MGKLIFKNWIDIARLDPDGPGSRLLAELITWQALSKTFLEEQDAVALSDHIQTILRDSNTTEVFTAACQAMCDMDLTPWLAKITSPALVIGGDEDVMTPWDQGPNGCGPGGDLPGDPGRREARHRGAGHSNDLRLDRGARTGRDRLLHAARKGDERARRRRRGGVRLRASTQQTRPDDVSEACEPTRGGSSLDHHDTERTSDFGRFAVDVRGRKHVYKTRHGARGGSGLRALSADG